MRLIFPSIATVMLLAPSLGAQGPVPRSHPVDILLAADRDFSAASGRTDLISGLSAMFADDVTMPVPRNGFAKGKAAVIEVLKSNPDNAKSKATWSPIRGGISADALHGFTYGYMTTEKSDGTKALGKYLAYWINGPSGWRVAVYKRAPRPEGEVSLGMRRIWYADEKFKPTTDAAKIARFRKSLDSVERAFSTEAQKIGLGPAFVKYGAPDAMNMGGSAEFAFGPEEIGKLVSQGEPPTGSTLSWAPQRVIVASSGDFGVTIGEIWPNDPPAAGQKQLRFPFFTIWRRASVNAPWRYVAE